MGLLPYQDGLQVVEGRGRKRVEEVWEGEGEEGGGKERRAGGWGGKERRTGGVGKERRGSRRGGRKKVWESGERGSGDEQKQPIHIKKWACRAALGTEVALQAH